MVDRNALGSKLGAHVLGEQTRFACYTDAEKCELVLEGRRHAMQLVDGVYELTLPAPHGSRYKFALDGRELPDPYARFVPDGPHAAAMVVEPRRQFKHGHVVRPLHQQVIYELHVGTFTQSGTYRAALDKLPELVKLGVTTLELLPVASFPGARGWGYDGVALWAPYAPYGTPDELRALVDEAHGLGLGVLLDVVYNHFGPAGNYLGAYHPSYFTHEVKNPWGDAPNYAHPAMRAFVVDNARYWLEEFHFDGLRLDAVHEIHDPKSERHVLRELVEAAHALGTRPILIAEDDRNDPRLVQDYGLDGIWADDFHHQLRVTLTGEQEGYYAGYQPGVAGIARAIERGWLYEGETPPGRDNPRGQPRGDLPRSALIYCIQNHDQIGNRALGERLSEDVDLEAYCLASTLLLFLPATPMLFMGQEWGTRAPFAFFSDHDAELGEAISRGRREEFKHFSAFSDPDKRARIPDPQDAQTFQRSKLPWDERDGADHVRVLALYEALLDLRQEDAVLRVEGELRAEAHGDVLSVLRFAQGEERLLLANFGATPVAIPDGYRELLRSGERGPELAPHTAVILARA
ncbi:MAG TPA: malto-oligosyltrehalose trehalohydrolase [Polyangiales bacterium]|nr:malto-oligosyltrehalose trehalohydrolase [Polyangiales bacterium]